MSLFVDTGVIYAHHHERAPRHDQADAAMRTIVTGSYGRLYTSEYVCDETVTLVRQRTGRFDAARRVADRIRGIDPFPTTFELLHVTEEDFDRTIDRFERSHDHSLSFTDASTIALVERYDIDALLSFDDDFDGLVERIDPNAI